MTSTLQKCQQTKMLRTNLQRKPPGLKSLPKCWWVKEIASDIYISGRLTSRQIKYASEAGLGALVSLYQDDGDSKFGGCHLPGTEETEQICNLAGLEFKSLIKHSEEWCSIETIDNFTSSIQTMKRPLLFIGDDITKVAYMATLYFIKRTVEDETFEPKFEAEDFYRLCTALGMVPVPANVDTLVEKLTGSKFEKESIAIGTDASVWTKYWLPQHISRKWYTSGQVRTDELDVIISAGFKTIVNLRLGMIHEDKPSQEPVNLLNLPDGFKTYSDDMKPARQVPEVAILNRIKPEVDTAYVGSESEVNFETRNPEEFGDEIGYNEEKELEFFEKSDLDYYHFPLVSGGIYDKSMFDDMRDTLLGAARKGPVLMQCRSGRRVSYFGVLIAAVEEGRDLQWALKRVAEMGFPIGPDLHPHTYKMYCDVLQ